MKRTISYWLLRAFVVLTRTVLTIAATILVLGVIVYFSLITLTEPSNVRDWNIDQEIMPEITWDNAKSTAFIKNVRNFKYGTSTTDYIPEYYDKAYTLDHLDRVYYIVEPFAGFEGSAHTFLSFEFKDPNTNKSEFVSISVEIRKEKGESFSAFKGLFNQYELMYVIADENDVVKLRSNYRKDLVYIYPIRTSKEKGIELFKDMLTRAQELRTKPSFYNTAFNNCTITIANHVNKISPNKLRWNKSYILPAYSDRYIYDLGMIDTTLPFEAARERFLINQKAIQYADDPLFSTKIRE